MCDTLVATGKVTDDGAVILAKNSDRHPNEAHVLAHHPRQQHPPGAVVSCTHIAIPQVAQTWEVLLAKPFWTWGCEMGVNEHGVAIGNEAVFTKEPYRQDGGLLGMDLVRLALERSESARQAVEVIVELLETYGQGGNHGLFKKEHYHNSFLIADPQGAWLLETAGDYWAAQAVQGVYAISNGLTLHGEWDRAAPDLVAHAVEKGWCRSPAEFDLARCYSDFLYTTLDGCRTRRGRSTELLQAEAGRITVRTMMAALRDHGPQAAENAAWNPGRGWLTDTLCVHAGFGPTRPSQTVGSMVVHLTPDLITCWLTGTAAPCTSIFKPVYLGGAGLPDLGPEPTGTYDPDSLWWSHERLHRAVIADYATRLPLYRAERDALESAFLNRAAELSAQTRNSGAAERAGALSALTAECFQEAQRASSTWTERVQAVPLRHRPSPLFALAWKKINRQARMPERMA